LQEDPRTSGKTNESTNNMPTMSVKSTDDLGPLPSGWEERTHADGRTFYINHGKFQYFIY